MRSIRVSPAGSDRLKRHHEKLFKVQIIKELAFQKLFYFLGVLSLTKNHNVFINIIKCISFTKLKKQKFVLSKIGFEIQGQRTFQKNSYNYFIFDRNIYG